MVKHQEELDTFSMLTLLFPRKLRASWTVGIHWALFRRVRHLADEGL
jgi:hypothetical protein